MMSNTQDAILGRIIEPEGNGIAPEVARLILAMDFPAEDHQRMAALSQMAQDGSLSADELEELDNYLHVSHFLAMVQSKARHALRRISEVS